MLFDPGSVALADVAAAKRNYSEALALARAGHLTEALERFQQAYAESPHHAVLYNMARVALDLGRTAEAATYLRRYLDEGGTRIPKARRLEVEKEIAALSVTASPERPETTEQPATIAPETAPPSTAPPLPAPEPAQVSPVTIAPEPVVRRADPGAPRSISPTQHVDHPQAAKRFQGAVYGLGGAGVALLGGAIAIKIWNHIEYNGWLGRHRALSQVTLPADVSSDDNLQQQRDYEYRRGRDVAERESIRRIDDVSWAGLAVGAGFLASAVLIELTLSHKAEVRAGSHDVSFALRF